MNSTARRNADSSPRAFGGEQFTQLGLAEVVGVSQHQRAQVQAELLQAHVGDGALGQVVADSAVAKLLRRLDFDGHAAIFHGQLLVGFCDIRQAWYTQGVRGTSVPTASS